MIYSSYDTIILDLDDTIWRGHNTNGIWAKHMDNTWVLDDKGSAIGNDNHRLKLDLEIRDFLNAYRDKNLGFLTRGGIKYVQWEDQPVIKCLKLFKIYHYFKYDSYVLYKDDKKSRVFLPEGKTLYIDDDNDQLADIRYSFPDVTVLNRHSFDKWTQLI